VILDETGYVRHIGADRHIPGYFVGELQDALPGRTVIPIESTLPNLARNKPATQSSLSRWSRGRTLEDDAGNAVNGDLSKAYGFHTEVEEHPWWKVDLCALASIKTVRIFNREAVEYVQLRASPLLVEISPDGIKWTSLFQTPREHLFSGFSGGTPLVWRAAANVDVVTRFIRVSIPRRECLHLAEIEIYGNSVETHER
jgi:hypothetical protein